MESRIEPIVCHYGADGRVMAYYIDAPCPTLIDTGSAVHPEGTIRAALQTRGTDLAALGAIINTHGHWDHAGGNAATVAASGAGVLIHEFGAPFLFDHRAHLDGYYTEAQRALEQPALDATQRAKFPTIFGAEMVPGRLLRDGDRIDLGDGVILQIIHVPGHSEDAIALWWESEGILFSGDAAQGASIARLREIPFRTLHTSHFFGRIGTAERRASYDAATGRDFLDESIAALDQVTEALEVALREDHEEPTFALLARTATEHLLASTDWGLVADPLTGVPDNLAPTLYRLWQEMKW
jgi:glyoxylase-like metal-dependent hydrolase (beta-lactamase superfamily II)